MGSLKGTMCIDLRLMIKRSALAPGAILPRSCRFNAFAAASVAEAAYQLAWSKEKKPYPLSVSKNIAVHELREVRRLLGDTYNELHQLKKTKKAAYNYWEDKAAGVLGARLNQFLREGWKAVPWPKDYKGKLSDLDILGPLPGVKVKQLRDAGVLLVRK